MNWNGERDMKRKVLDSRIILWTNAPIGLTFNGKDDYINLGSKAHLSSIIGEPSILKELSRETLTAKMLFGTTCWWEKIDESWVFRFTENKDVYDEIFNSLNPIALVKIYVRHLSIEERKMLELYDKFKFICKD